jgi:hypothetical protein
MERAANSAKMNNAKWKMQSEERYAVFHSAFCIFHFAFCNSLRQRLGGTP